MRKVKFEVVMSTQQYQELMKRASVRCGVDENEDFNPQDYSGGNFNDCYQMGIEHADVDAALEILQLLGTPQSHE